MAKIGIALSGGGHRASLFGLGALLYLADARKNQEVTSISSVSGGSLTNAYVAQVGGYQELRAKETWAKMAPFARQIAQYGTLWASKLTWLYVLVLTASLLSIICIWWASWPWLSRCAIFLVSMAVWAVVLASRRGEVCGRAFAETLFSPHGKTTRLHEIEKRIDHIICATDLHAAEHVYFSGNFVYSYRFGFGDPADLPLHSAVQASAAFPGAFPPRLLRTARFNFMEGRHHAAFMVLSDGGVYDNLAEQWAWGLSRRRKRLENLGANLKEIDELVVVNSSAGLDWHSLKKLQIPLVGELYALLEVVNSLYENTTSPRKSMLIDRFDRAAREQKGLKGALVSIDQTPYKVAEIFTGSSDWPDRAERAEKVLRLFSEEDQQGWESLVQENSQTATTLSKLGKERSAKLIYQGYVVAMTNSHVILDYPLLEIPPLQQFDRFVSKISSGAISVKDEAAS